MVLDIPSTTITSSATQPTRVEPGSNRVWPCAAPTTTTTGSSIVSQNFEAAYDVDDTRGADDFTMSQSFAW